MKTWQMFKELEEGSTKRYTNGIVIFGTHNGCLKTFDENLKPNGFGSLSSNVMGWSRKEWEEIKESVTWQEALEAWSNGEVITCFIGKNRTMLYRQDNFSYPLNLEQIRIGAWYIGEPND